MKSNHNIKDMKAENTRGIKGNYIIIGLIVIILFAIIAIVKNSQQESIVAINVTEGNSSWKIANAGNTKIKVEVSNGITGFIIRELGIGNSKEVPKENVEITAKQED